jgi:hypothetical protein
MSDVIVFRPKADLDASQNLKGFIDSCRGSLTVFGSGLNFEENVWDITESLALKGHGNKRHRLVFSTFATVNDASPVALGEPFLSFSKAFVRYMQGLRPTKNVAFRLAALRALEAALTENGGASDPTKTDLFILNRAGQLLAEKYEAATAYRIGGQLELLATFLSDNALTVVPVRWRNYLKRPGDAVRVGKEFDRRREEKMPSSAALDALPKVFRLAKDPGDVIFTSVAALLCAAPDRINEVLLLPEQCEVWQKSRPDAEESYGLRWWPAKGAEPMVKWIVPSMISVVQDAISRIRTITSEARQVSRWYEDNPSKIYLDENSQHLRSKEWLTMTELREVIGLGAGRSTPLQWCRTFDVPTAIFGRQAHVRFSDVEQAVLARLPVGFPILDRTTGTKFSEALFVVRVNEINPQKAPYRCLVETVTINQINSGLGGRAEHGFSSIFTRFGFVEADGEPIKITTHQFRHYLNTLAQAGGMSQLDIAKWSGRKDVRQNAAYDHVTPDQMLQKIRDAIGDDSQMFGPLAEIPKRVLIPRDEFARLRIPTAHTTELGFCVHDYTMSPCQLHRDCIHCEDLVCVKGDEEKTIRLRQNLEEARKLLRKAEGAVANGYVGGDRWLVHHQSTVERLSQLCSIMDDPRVPPGAVVQLAPPQSADRLDAGTSKALLPTDQINPPAGLLADLLTSMGA